MFSYLYENIYCRKPNTIEIKKWGKNHNNKPEVGNINTGYSNSVAPAVWFYKDSTQKQKLETCLKQLHMTC
jgi:hypothetical protein